MLAQGPDADAVARPGEQKNPRLRQKWQMKKPQRRRVFDA